MKRLFITIFLFTVVLLSWPGEMNAASETCSPSHTLGTCIYIAGTPAQKPDTLAALSYGGYLRDLYNLLLGFTGVAALAAMVFGGVIYISSMGNPSKISEAKRWIFNGLYGLLLAGFSYIVLNTINPELIPKGGFEVKSPPPK